MFTNSRLRLSNVPGKLITSLTKNTEKGIKIFLEKIECEVRLMFDHDVYSWRKKNKNKVL